MSAFMKAGLVCALVVFWSCLAQGHHFVTSTYDYSRQLEIEVVVEEFRFINPHPYVSARALDNPKTLLTLEMDNRRELVQLGFTEVTLKPGDRIRMTAIPSRFNLHDFYVHAFEHPRLGFKYVTNMPQLFNLQK